MSKHASKKGRKHPTPNDQRSLVKNPPTEAFKADEENRLNQLMVKEASAKELKK